MLPLLFDIRATPSNQQPKRIFFNPLACRLVGKLQNPAIKMPKKQQLIAERVYDQELVLNFLLEQEDTTKQKLLGIYSEDNICYLLVTQAKIALIKEEIEFLQVIL